MSFFVAICFALTVNPGRVALWIVQPLILCVLYSPSSRRRFRTRSATGTRRTCGFTFAFRERDGYFGLEMERKD